MNLPDIISHFDLPGPVTSQEEIPTGLINSTYLLTLSPSAGGKRYVLQAINSTVFPKPLEVMENIAVVTSHLAKKSGRQLQLVQTKAGADCFSEENGTVWRCYDFIEDTESFSRVSSADLAYRAGVAFGSFLAELSDLAPSTLNITLPGFHDTPKELAKWEKAVRENPCNRLATVMKECEFVQKYQNLAPQLVAARLPQRITHNDTKISNVLFPKNPKEQGIVIDLDTVMPGLSLFDYGDLIRSGAATSGEDESDLERVYIDRELQSALTEGYLSAAADVLCADERRLLPVSVNVITFELGVRFLTDYLMGDRYFRTAFPEQNLDRARNQFALLRSLR